MQRIVQRLRPTADATPPLHIVAIDASIAPTGALRAISNLAEILDSRAQVTLVLPNASKVPPNSLGAFAEVVYLPIVNLRRNLASLALYLPSLIWCGWRVASLASRKGAQVVILNDFYLMQGILARLFGYSGQLIAWVRIDPERFPRSLCRQWLSLVYRYCDRIVAVSDFILRRLPPSQKVIRVYDYVDDPGLTAGLGAKSADAETIVFVGNYIRGKGQDDAIDAFSRVADQFPESRLLFFGGDMGLDKNRAFREQLERAACAYGLSARIIFRGFEVDVEQAYRQGAIALNLSASESFSFTCLEASSFALPVIAYRSGGPEEIIIDGETGFLCPLGNVAAVASALRKLLSTPTLARSMGLAGTARAASVFGREQFLQSLCHILPA